MFPPQKRNENSQQLGVMSKRKCVVHITAKINHHAEVTFFNQNSCELKNLTRKLFYLLNLVIMKVCNYYEKILHIILFVLILQNKNVCCGHYVKPVADITFLERYISSHIYYSFLFCWVFYMFSKDIIKLNINKSSL